MSNLADHVQLQWDKAQTAAEYKAAKARTKKLLWQEPSQDHELAKRLVQEILAANGLSKTDLYPVQQPAARAAKRRKTN